MKCMNQLSIDRDKIIKKLSEEFNYKELVRTQDLLNYLKDVYPEYSKNSLYWVISDYNQKNIIRRVSRGYYVINNVGNEKSYYVALIGDIKASRQLYAENPNFDQDLINAINRDVTLLQKQIHIPKSKDIQPNNTFFDIVLGDEINFYSELNELFSRKFLLILYHVRPAYIRFIIDAGEALEKKADKFEKVNNYLLWNARDYFLKLKDKKDNPSEYTGIVWPESKKLENIMLKVILDIIGSWTSKQWEVIYQRLFKKSLEDIALDIGVSSQAVHDRIVSARYDLVMDVFDEFSKLLWGDK